MTIQKRNRLIEWAIVATIAAWVLVFAHYLPQR